MKTYKDSHIGKNIGKEYDTVLSNRFESFIFEIEKIIIRKILRKYYKRIDSSLDFACGTGRITRIIEKYVKNPYAIDISKDMIKTAKKRCRRAKLIVGDISKSKIIKNKRFDLITAWRFFLNAEYSLKKDILLKLRKYLKDDGYLVFNIHMNRSSIVGFQFFIRKKLFKQKVINTMSISEVRKLLKRTGYKIREIYPLAHFPGRLNFLLLPKKMLMQIELALTRSKFLGIFAKDLIFVCQKRKL